jgi:hypothetical protein
MSHSNMVETPFAGAWKRRRQRRCLTIVILLSPTLGLVRPAPLAAEPVLHEYVAPPGHPTDRSLVKEGQLPPQIPGDDQMLPQPDNDPAPAPGERVLGKNNQLDRSTEVRPDRTTTEGGALDYHATFNPSVVPFKRMAALDQVGPQYVMRVKDQQLREEPLSTVQGGPDRDLFWGSVIVRFAPQRPVALPSVAPEARIISYSTTPRLQLRFFRDSADNFWVKSDQPGQVRLIFLTDAPKHYFSPVLPPSVKPADVPTATRPVLPKSMRKAAAQVLRRLELNESMTMARLLERLTAYFRSFKPGALPPSTGDTYLDIALSQRGICRHRSFAFVVTAQALGIPARYVTNEAHAFTEVFMPRLGWIRIDLGGAAPELRVTQGDKKAVHRPGPDPFPQPYPLQSSRVIGLNSAGGHRARGGSMSLQVFQRPADRVAPSSETPLRRERPAMDRSSAPISTTAGESAEDPSTAATEATQLPTQLMLLTTAHKVFRGETIEVWGKLTHRGAGLPRMRVEIYLSRDGLLAEVLLGATLTASSGEFRATLPIPLGIDVGDYQVYAATPGDGHFAPSISP